MSITSKNTHRPCLQDSYRVRWRTAGAGQAHSTVQFMCMGTCIWRPRQLCLGRVEKQPSLPSVLLTSLALFKPANSLEKKCSNYRLNAQRVFPSHTCLDFSHATKSPCFMPFGLSLRRTQLVEIFHLVIYKRSHSRERPWPVYLLSGAIIFHSSTFYSQPSVEKHSLCLQQDFYLFKERKCTAKQSGHVAEPPWSCWTQSKCCESRDRPLTWRGLWKALWKGPGWPEGQEHDVNPASGN